MAACTACGTPRPAMAPTAVQQRYRTHIFRGDMQISGITLIQPSDGMQRGTVINEFGIKAFDFENTPRRCRLLHAVGPVGHFPVRRMLARDLHFWLAGLNGDTPVPSGPRHLSFTPQGIEVRNERTGLQYLFTSIP